MSAYADFYQFAKGYYTEKEIELLWDHIIDFDEALKTLTDEERGRK
jgi:hypothetical protein